MSKLGRTFAAIGSETLRRLRAVAPETKSLDIGTIRSLLSGQQTAGYADRCGESYRALVTLGYARNVCVLRAVNEIATGVASVPIDVYAGEERQEKSQLADLLMRPNLGVTKTRFFEDVISYYLLDGNAFVLAVPPDGGRPLGLQTLRPDFVDVQRKGASTVYTYDPGSDIAPRETWTATDTSDDLSPIMHLRAFSPFARPRGMAPLIAARSAIDAHNLADDWNANVIRNGAKMPGFLLVEKGANDGSLTPAERDSIKTMIEEVVGGAKNAGKIPVLEGGLRFQPTGWSPTDLDWSGGKASAARDAVNALGYPPMLLGIPGDNTFSNQREARLALWENTIIPMLLRLLDELTQWLGPRYGEGIRLVPNLDAVPALALRRSYTWDMLKGVEFATPNEQRKIAGFDRNDSPSADVLLVSYAKVPIDDLGQSVVLQESSDGPTDPDADPVTKPPSKSAPKPPAS